METRPNAERSATRYAPYVVELHEFFKSRGMRFGHSEDIVAFAADLGAKGSFHDEMMSMARAIIFREGGVVPRNELLELIVFAVGGARTDETGAMDGPVGALHEFVDEVMQSFRRRSFVEDEPEEEELAAPLETLETETPLEEEEPAFVAARPVREVVVEEDWRMDAVTPKQAHSSTGAFARAQMRSEAEWEERHPGEPFDAAPLHGAGLVAVERAPAPKPPDHFFRNAMLALVVCFAALLLWRHRNPVPVAQEHRETSLASSVAAPSSLPGGDERSGISGTTVGRTTSQAGTRATAQPDSGSRPAGDTVPPVAGGAPVAGAIAAPIPPISPPPPASAGPGSASPARVRRARRAPSAGAVQTANGGPPNATNHPGAFLVSSGMMDGNLISSPKPKYPKMAGMMGVEGQVILQAVVSSKGTVVAAHVLEGHHLLRGAAVHAVRGWRYRPYMVDGKATDVATIVIVDFHLPH